MAMTLPPELLQGLHPRALAHLGDAVYELFIREQALLALGAGQSNDLHKFTTERVCAAYQANWLSHWLDHDLLTAEETDLLRRARNLPVTTRRRLDQALYRQATAFEALIGWWHLTDRDRLAVLLAQKPPTH